MTAPLTTEQITEAVNSIAALEAKKRGIDPDIFRITLVPHLRSPLFVDFGKGPTVQVLLQLDEALSGHLMMHIKAVIQLLLKHHRSQYSLVPISFVRAMAEQNGKMKESWKKGRAWDEVYERVPDLIDAARVRVVHETVTKYIDMETDTVIEKRTATNRVFNQSADSTSAWMELSALVNETHTDAEPTTDGSESSVSSAFDRTESGSDSGSPNERADIGSGAGPDEGPNTEITE